MQRLLGPGGVPECGGGGHWWYLLRQLIKSSPSLWWQQDCHSLHPETRTHKGPTYTVVQHHNRAGLVEAGVVVRCERQRRLRHSKGCHHCQLHRWHIEQPTETCASSVSNLLKPVPHPELKAHMGPLWSRTALLWGKGAGAGRRESTHLKGTELAWTWHPGLLLHQLGNWPWPW